MIEKSNVRKNSPHPKGDSVGDAYGVKESYTDVGKPERVESKSVASDSYPQHGGNPHPKTGGMGRGAGGY